MNNNELAHYDYLKHYGILGMKWGVRRFQNKDGTLTPAGKIRYRKNKDGTLSPAGKENIYQRYGESQLNICLTPNFVEV